MYLVTNVQPNYYFYKLNACFLYLESGGRVKQ